MCMKDLIKKILKEEIDLNNYKPSFSAEDFTNWVDSEFDVETLEMVHSKIEERISLLNHLIGVANRKEIKGFRKDLGEGTRCWKGYEKKGMKTMFGKRVPNCVKRKKK